MVAQMRLIASRREYRMQQLLHVSYRWARRVAIAVIGGTVLLVGVAMVVLPGPAIIMIPAGLAILGLEFAWARRWLEKVKSAREQVVKRFHNSRKPRVAAADQDLET